VVTQVEPVPQQFPQKKLLEILQAKYMLCCWQTWNKLHQCSDTHVKKGKGFPYSLPSVGPGGNPGVQAVSPQVIWVIQPAVGCHYFLPGLRLPPQPQSITALSRYQVIVLGVRDTSVWTTCPRLLRSFAQSRIWTHDLLIARPTLYLLHRWQSCTKHIKAIPNAALITYSLSRTTSNCQRRSQTTCQMITTTPKQSDIIMDAHK